jgi:hypothetical protein
LGYSNGSIMIYDPTIVVSGFSWFVQSIN